MNFSFGKNKYTAIDIGSSSIKAVVMVKNNNGLELKSAGYRELPPGIINEGEINDKSIVASEIKELLNDMNQNPKKIITTIPSTHLITRNVEIPKLDKNELKEALKWELDDVLPYSAEESTFDYIITEEKDETLNVLLIAAKNKIIKQYNEPFKELGIKTNVINVQPMALISLLDYQDKLKESSAIVDLGHQGTRVILGDEDNLLLTRTINQGGLNFTQNIKDNQQIDYKEAEEYKKNHGIDNNESGLDSLEDDVSLLGIGNEMTNIAREIVDEISRSIEFYSIKNRGESIDDLYITGGSSLLKGIIDLIEDETGLKPKIINPFTNINIDTDINQIKKEVFTIVMGLCVSEVMHNES